MSPFYRSVAVEHRPSGWTVLTQARKTNGLTVTTGMFERLEPVASVGEIGEAVIRMAALGTDNFESVSPEVLPFRLLGFSTRREYLRDALSVDVILDEAAQEADLSGMVPRDGGFLIIDSTHQRTVPFTDATGLGTSIVDLCHQMKS